MATTPKDDEPGFETDVNDLPQSDRGLEDTLEDKPRFEEGDASRLEEAQKEGAEERTGGGYH